MTNDKATTRQIEYVCKLAKFACSLPTKQRANVFSRLHNWARSWDNQFWIEDEIEYVRADFAYEMNTDRARRKASRELRSFGETVLSDSPYEVIWLEEISQQEYENNDNWLDSFATLE